MTAYDAIALDVALGMVGNERLRRLCSDANPDADQREGYRRLVLRLAGAPAPTPEPNPTPEDRALRDYVARHGGCCH